MDPQRPQRPQKLSVRDPPRLQRAHKGPQRAPTGLKGARAVDPRPEPDAGRPPHDPIAVARQIYLAQVAQRACFRSI